MTKVNYSLFEGQTSSSEDLYILASDYNYCPTNARRALRELLKHYSKDVRKQARILAKNGLKKAGRKARRYLIRKGYTF